jgi:hypothetical protein
MANLLARSLNTMVRAIDAHFDLTSLSTNGVVVVPVLTEDLTDDFKQCETEFPEFFPGANPMVLGGYAAYGNPSSFHHPMFRKLRRDALETVIRSGVFQKYLKAIRPDTWDQYGVEVLFDRVMHRHQGQSPSAETAHRDVTPAKYLKEQDDDHIFGGWLNLGNAVQTFTAQPGA